MNDSGGPQRPRWKFFQVLEDTRRRAQAGPLLDLSTGDPLVLQEVSDALGERLRELARGNLSDRLSTYRDLDGLPELRAQIAQRCSALFGRTLQPANVLITPGAQAALRFLLVWLRQKQQAVAYPLGLEYSGMFDLENERRVTGVWREGEPQTEGRLTFDLDGGPPLQPVGASLLSRPHSPTGRYWSHAELERVVAWGKARGAVTVLDETYASPWAPLIAGPHLPFDDPESVIHVYSFSKIGLAGERVGAIVASTEAVEQLRTILRSHVILSPKLGQQLALTLIDLYLKNPGWPALLVEAYQRRHRRCREALLSTLGAGSSIQVPPWEGGPFLWAHWTKGSPSWDVFQELLRRRVAVAPAEAFQVPGESAQPSLSGLRIGLGGEEADLGAAMPIVGETLARELR